MTSVTTQAGGAAPTRPTAVATFTVNGEPVRLTLDPRESLLDVLRERLGLTGTKKGCDQGQCGAYVGIVAAIRQTAGRAASRAED